MRRAQESENRTFDRTVARQAGLPNVFFFSGASACSLWLAMTYGSDGEGAQRRAERRSRSRSRSRSREASVDWHSESLWRSLDALFHTPSDAYPRGCAEHAELRTFVPKLAAAERQASASSHGTLQSRQSVRVLTGEDRHGRPERPGGPTGHAAQCRAPPPAPRWARLPSALTAQYQSYLNTFEDFLQRRSWAKLLALAKAKASLPVAPYGETIAALLREHPVLVLAAETGAGKSTQVPQFLLKAGFRHIAVTQPRRLAACALAARVGLETLHTHGAGVGYRVRFDATANAGSAVVFLTEGVLLRELTSDPLLTRYDVIIVDEAHERHVATDLLLGLLKRLLQRRTTLRVVVMSATIELRRFAAFFDGCPVLQVPGRTHPIRVEWVPPLGPDGQPLRRLSNAQAAALAVKGGATHTPRIDPQPYLHLLQRLDASVPADQRGDLLVFLPGALEIDAVAAALAPYAASTRRWVILPLHAALPADAQARVFEAAPPRTRKAVLATNIAETSVTLDGIRFVIDSGRAKLMKHHAAFGGGALREGWVSAAAAAQRAGRAGRTGPGVVYRLYSAEEHGAFEAFTPPEILRAPLQGVLLQLAALSAGRFQPEAFPWLDPPAEEDMRRAMDGLVAAGALEGIGGGCVDGDHDARRLTSLGHALASLPCDVAPGKLLLLAAALRCLSPGAALAAALCVATPLLRVNAAGGGGGGGGSGDACGASRAARAALESPHGDAPTLLRLFGAWAEQQQQVADARGGAARRWCRSRGLDESRLVETAKLHMQLQQAVSRPGGALIMTGETSSSSSSDEGGGGGAAHAVAQPREASAEVRRARAARRELRQLQGIRERARGRGVLALAEDGFARGEAERSDGDQPAGARHATSAPGRMRELELSLGANLTSAASCARLPEEAHPLLLGLLLLALYPSVALPSPGNAARREGEHSYEMAHRADAALHPSCSLLGSCGGPPGQGEAVIFAEALETHRLFLCHVTRVPAAALLLAARRVETDAQGGVALLDGWILLRFADSRGPEAIHTAAALRQDIDAILAARLRGGMAGRTDDAAPPTAPLHAWAVRVAARVPALEVDDVVGRLAAFMRSPPGCTATSSGSPATLAGLRSGEGTAVRSWLHVGALRGEASPLAALAATPHLRAHWSCPTCGIRLIAHAAEIEQHAGSCGRPAETAVLEASEVAEREGEGQLGRSYYCAVCARELWMSPTAWLRHRAAHEPSAKTRDVHA